jgi:hypothetical protein
MIAAETTFAAVACPRCAAPVLSGCAAGLAWRLDPYPVSPERARLLKWYGVSVLLLVRRAAGPWADFWEPEHDDLTQPGRYLTVPHVCGSAHARGEETP